ncbi:MAG: diaminopimelate epimerase [Alphaproteobacteria bacterium]|nr:diaminopimelate epimerase [Alphaproteobacteria bacterium]
MIAFRKMHGLGNDFVVLDLRPETVRIAASEARAIADRRTGIGCDQVILLEPARNPKAQLFMRIRNPDGSEAEACGNATRCVAQLVAAETGDRRVRIETVAGLLEAETAPDGNVSVDMGPALTEWEQIPLARAMDTIAVDLSLGPLATPVCTNLGNPHATFFVEDADAIDLGELGPRLERDELFPNRANIGVAAVADRGSLRLRVWERGAGITPACGSGACAALVAAHRRGVADRHARVVLDGGALDVLWREDGHVVMTGPATLSFEGRFDPAALRLSA